MKDFVQDSLQHKHSPASVSKCSDYSGNVCNIILALPEEYELKDDANILKILFRDITGHLHCSAFLMVEFGKCHYSFEI